VLDGVTPFPAEFAARYRALGYWELSGWAPKYFPPSLRSDIRGRMREKMMFVSDHPSLPYERILREWDELGYDQSVLDVVFHASAERVLGL
jgi:predicted TIM-barrel fold metal-dependent hydrolase